MVIGAGRKFTGALIVPSYTNLTDWCKANNIILSAEEDLRNNEKVGAFYKEVIDDLNKNFSNVEQIKKFELLAQDWSVEKGELTPKLSLKRKVIMERYSDAVERIYS